MRLILNLTDTLQRGMILRSNGTDPALIRYLLNDAQLLEILKDDLRKQIETFRSFRTWYESESARAIHEMPLEGVRKVMAELKVKSADLEMMSEAELRRLAESFQSMIQLV